MMKNILLKFLLIFIISCSLSGQALAVYKHKVIVAEFDDPQGWTEPYHPGKILSHRLKQHLIDGGRFHMLGVTKNGKMPDSMMKNQSHGGMGDKNLMEKGPDHKSSMNKSHNMSDVNNMTGFKSESSNAGYQNLNDVEPAIHYSNIDSFGQISPVQGSMMSDMDKMSDKAPVMHDPVPWPVRLGRIPEKASLFEIRGQVLKFDPGNMDAEMMDKDQTGISEQAELEIMLQLVQNKTGRVIHKQKFRAFSNSGRRAFSKNLDLGLDEVHSLGTSSMGIAFSFLTKEMVSFVNNSISRGPLEGEIIALKNEDVLINIGRQNGVQIGDRFRVHSVGLQLDDPLTEQDLGDIYVKMGTIQVLESMLGFSRARVIVGKDFMPGNLVRSFKDFNDSSQQFTDVETLYESEDPVPWWSFHGIKSVP